MTAAGRLTVSMIVAAPFAASCSGEKPHGVVAEGWLAARCEAASKILLDGGDADMGDEFEEWRGLTDPFSGTTDSSMELRGRARVSVGSLFDGRGKARRFVVEKCGPDAAADVRRSL